MDRCGIGNYSRGFHPLVYCCMRLEITVPSPGDVRVLFSVMSQRDYPLTISCLQGSQIINAKTSIDQSFVEAALWVVGVAPVLSVLNFHKSLPFSSLP